MTVQLFCEPLDVLVVRNELKAKTRAVNEVVIAGVRVNPISVPVQDFRRWSSRHCSGVNAAANCFKPTSSTTRFKPTASTTRFKPRRLINSGIPQDSTKGSRLIRNGGLLVLAMLATLR
jgi:hypothetical protein